MEKEGFIRVILRLATMLSLFVISTDRNTQIKKLMRVDQRFAEFIHQFDPWHMAKNLSKKLVKAAKKKGIFITYFILQKLFLLSPMSQKNEKCRSGINNIKEIVYRSPFKNLMLTSKVFEISGCEELMKWIPAIVNHLYWCVQKCGQNGEKLVEMFNSCIHHVVDRHEFPGEHYTKCPHEDDTSQYEWMTAGSPPHEALKRIVLHKTFQKDLAWESKRQTLFTV